MSQQQTYGEYMRSNPPIPNLTAVEWLQHLYENRPESDLLEQDFEQAKQIEKEQIIKAASVVLWNNSSNSTEAAEQYYNETYGK